MKRTLIYTMVIAVLLTSFSCSKELDKANINPNATENAQPDYLLTGAIKATADAYWGTANNMNSSLLFVQHWAKIQYTEEDRFVYSNSSFTTLWNTGYSQSITSFNKIMELGTSLNNNNYKGVALILRSWVFLLLTDAYGDIPYKQAGSINQYITPAFDPQKDVYFGLLDDLKTAKATLDPAGKAIAGDIIYSGNIARWKKLANSLRIRIALRIADREAEKSKQVIAEITAEGDPYISDNLDNAQLVYLSSPQQNPVSASFETRDDYRISKTMVDKLFQLNDPRLPVYASKTQTATPQEYIGVPNGSTTSEASNLGFARTSKPGAYFLSPQAPAVIFSYAELLFNQAEAAARGFTAQNAADLYQQAIRASFKQYNISDAAATAYLAQGGVQYNNTNFRKSIGEQKWIALFGQGLEAFAERRRQDYPELVASPNTVLNGQLPSRFIYPGTEQSLNGDNYKKAVANQGPDLLTTRLWFDVK
ncbi:SusD/RagB family nutrient-binding outer membrane lipoprotein [Segetibacter sp. 3557_3]|uniref:SusD/RagB family nutrient-binding outer membrane lipoprotein n=1 Tax=Segetibacter sp. 3557_3 TaxID=2547429 RepID=UPI001058DB28|nr:SusD/RagB family nutrient-binding outer membrane lipoprotein [Segetibacter sp. 3557_3]TDH19987.1 SusD/RagB family nutrient-binding outer membrane lipoprotein [Segetibacter sp. 3557_3]